MSRRQSDTYDLSNLTPGTFPYRLRQIMGKESVFSFARRSGIADSNLRKYLTGVQPSMENLLALAQTAGVSLDWLVAGEGQAHPLAPDLVEIPVHDVAVGAGGICFSEDHTNVVTTLRCERGWLQQQFPGSLGRMALVYVRGESMEPTLRSGDLVLIERQPEVVREGVFVVRVGDGLLVKRLIVYPGQYIEVSSDNPAYKPFRIDLNEPHSDFAIIGRVLCSLRCHL